MSLSARLAIESSRLVALAECVFPLLGLAVATGTIVARSPAAATVVIPVAAVATLIIVRRNGRLRSTRGTHRLTLADRPEFGVVFPDGSFADARLVESTVVWSGFWMLAFRRAESPRVVRLAVLPWGLDADARRSLGRFLLWATRGGGSSPGAEIPLR